MTSNQTQSLSNQILSNRKAPVITKDERTSKSVNFARKIRNTYVIEKKGIENSFKYQNDIDEKSEYIHTYFSIVNS